ncbi:MAG: FAD-dependent oxidoreductase [Anderseniella sp.]|nr:FAD-dependent oxidoreductase [Anderseniella sp.]
MSDQPDVVIVGAGAAGVGAGMELKRCGVPFVILEASGRVGGRAYTDKTSLPYAWDKGCHWLHCADVNPLVAESDRVGAQYLKGGREDWNAVWANGDWADQAGRANTLRIMEAAFEAVYEAGGNGRDVPISDVLPDAGQWAPIVRHWIQLMSSGDPEQVSTRSYADYQDTEQNWPMKSGYGDLIERLAAGLPVQLGMPVSGIEQRADGVRVTTGSGTSSAKAAIVTVSTAVLNSGAIEISAGPARDVLTLMENVPCGFYEKVAIAFDKDVLGDIEQPSVNILPEDGSEPINFQFANFGNPMVIGHVAGSVARQLLAEGDAAMVEFAMQRLVAAFGSDIKARMVNAATTDWGSNPFVRGGYSFAKPGCAHHRHQMIEADTGNLAFAGEAFSRQWEATAHGAWASGRDVAGRLVDNLASAG